MGTKRALLLSGGGAKGAFQAGALRYIYETEAAADPGTPYFQVVSGVSVGTLNGVLVAQNRMDRLNELWGTLSEGDIFRGGMGVPGVFRHFLMRTGSLLDNTPMREIIFRNAVLEEVLETGVDLMFGAVSLETGEYYSFHASDFDDEMEFRKALLASAPIPVVCPPVEEVRTRGRRFSSLVDGGVRNARPLGRVLDLEPDEVVIINCNSDGFITEPARRSRTIRVALRLLTEVTLHELFRRDVREFQNINALVRSVKGDVRLLRRDGRVYRYVPEIVIEPSGAAGDSMDFSRPAIDRQLKAGYLAAREAFERFRGTGS